MILKEKKMENCENIQIEVITTLEAEQKELHHLVAQLSKGKHSANYIGIHSLISNSKIIAEDHTLHQELVHVCT
jgi:hypothetical protein